jgi:transposase InsO family protein
VAAVVDLFSRRVVGWSMNAAMTAQLVTDALVMAIWRRGKPDALLHHSDRGSQYFCKPSFPIAGVTRAAALAGVPVCLRYSFSSDSVSADNCIVNAR